MIIRRRFLLMFVAMMVVFTIFGFVGSQSVFASSLSLTVSTDLLSTDIAPNSVAGSFATSNATNVSVTTDFTTGYTLSIKAGTTGNNATSLVNTNDSTKTITSISSTISESDFSAAANTQYNNQWGYKPSKFNSVANTTNYYPSPTETGDVLDKTSTSNSTANAYDISFGTRVDVETIPGTYSNTYIITAIGNPTPYSITYDKNTTDDVTNMPTPNPDIGGTYDDHTVLSSTKPERSGYKFVSWCTTNESESSCLGTSYQAGGNYAVDPDSSTGNTATLYAIWVKSAMLDTGQSVNQKLKRLAGNSTATSSTQDDTITALARSDSLPSGFTPATENTISTSSSTIPIYAWFDSENTTINYYSEAPNIMMNSNSNSLFREMRALSNLTTISTWDTSSVTNMSSMFYNAGYSATTWSVGDLSSWDTSSVKNMIAMFYYSGYNATTWSVGDLSSWDTSSVTNMIQLFYYAGYSATVWSVGDLSTWNTSSVTNMNSIFYNAGHNATSWAVGTISSWNTSKVTNMNGMFYQAGYSATAWSVGDLSSWSTSKVTDMASMFSGAGHSATAWSVGDLSSWDTSKVTSMSHMFNQAGYNAATWSVGDLSSWDTSKVTSMINMFYQAGYSASTWSVGNLSTWDTSNVLSMLQMFCSAGYNATSFSLNLASWNTISVTDMTNMFYDAGHNATTWSVGNLSAWDTSSVKNMGSMFQFAGYNATTWSVGDLSVWDTSKVTNMVQMFFYAGYNATTWSVGDLSAWDTSSVTNMNGMFYQAGYYATDFYLDLSSWDTSSVTNMGGMFTNAGRNATTWSITIPKTNDGTATGPIPNTASNLYGSSTSVTAAPPYGRSFTLAE